MASKEFKVQGMTCNGCAGTIKNILTLQEGVEEADVRYPENLATVTFDETKISEERMMEVVKMMGYGLESKL